MKKRLNGCRGFTFLEIVIVIAVIGLLVILAAPNFIRARRAAQAQKVIQQLAEAKNQAAPELGLELGDEISYTQLEKYLEKGLPEGFSYNEEDEVIKSRYGQIKINRVGENPVYTAKK